ncbi:hypothetical protein JCM24511_08787 [Saitozyma sp. JCM 24511]|nr:hypothetical protein JCM24511_08787 [Saitozyma sp. JCM 24511]
MRILYKYCTHDCEARRAISRDHGLAKTDKEIRLWMENDQVAKRQMEIYNRLVELIWADTWAGQYTRNSDADKGLRSKMMKTSSEDADAEEDKDHDSAEDDGKSEGSCDADDDGEEERDGMVRSVFGGWIPKDLAKFSPFINLGDSYGQKRPCTPEYLLDD